MNILDNDTASSLFPSRPEARVRSIVRAACGHDWTERFPHIREALAAPRARSATIDGEAVVCCPETGLSLRSAALGATRPRGHPVRLRPTRTERERSPLEERKATLGDLLAPITGGIALSEHIEADGLTVFRHARKLGCEGIVSKQRASFYRSGRTKTWLKIKNPESPAMTRVWER